MTNLNVAARTPAGSSLRNEIRNPTPDNVADPLEVLSTLLGKPTKSKSENSSAEPEHDPPELIAEIDCGGLSLQDFVKQGEVQNEKAPDVHSYTVRSIEECTFHVLSSTQAFAHVVLDDKEKEKFEDLHKSITVRDSLLYTSSHAK